LGIDGIEIREVPVTESRGWRSLPDAVRDTILRDVKGKRGKIVTYELQSIHHSQDVGGSSQAVMLDFVEDESAGTKKVYALSGPVIATLNNGWTLLSDELDARLHPLLSKWMIGLFHEKKANKKDGQLIFATHDSNLLEKDFFRRDQVWFTEKDPNTGASALYSLWDFKPPRKEENLRKGYLAGRYGAIPFTGSVVE
jgi:AAA15 family ATPase/GTPase